MKNYCPSFRLWNSFSIFNTINKISKNIRTKDRFIKINFNKINKILLAKKALVFSKSKFKVTFLHKTIFNKSLGKKDSKEAKRIAYFLKGKGVAENFKEKEFEYPKDNSLGGKIITKARRKPLLDYFFVNETVFKYIYLYFILSNFLNSKDLKNLNSCNYLFKYM